MSLDASKAHLGELALDWVRAFGLDPAAAVPWFRLLAKCDAAGQLVRQQGGRAWWVYVECDLDDVVTIRLGDLHGFLEEGRISGGPIMFILACAGADRQWPINSIRRRERQSKCRLVAFERPDGRLLQRVL